MSAWRPQQYRGEALASGADPVVVENATRSGEYTVAGNRDRPPVLSLRHLAHMADVPYVYLRNVVSRGKVDAYRSGEEFDPYRLFRIHKRVSTGCKRYRVICVPDPMLLRVQSWIASRILRTAITHRASTAFAQGDDIRSAAQIHCSARWLIKLDVENFFESITEIAGYRAFLSLGYQPLVAFELARICTRIRQHHGIYRNSRWRTQTWKYGIWDYSARRLGYLPQGAPTSPMLSNLCVAGLDEEIDAIATAHGLRYSRYADDISLSTTGRDFTRLKAVTVVRAVYNAMAKQGLSPNRGKTQVRPPGSRKVVLGLLVDGPRPRLTRQFKASLRMHLHFLCRPEVGPVRHAGNRGFESIIGLRSHVRGLIAHAQMVEPEYADGCLAAFGRIVW